MQLKNLWIKDYKNLKDFSLNFEKGNNLSILIGNNGSGKSNVLEAISGIFAEWYGKSNDEFDTDYIISYIKNDIEYELKQEGLFKKSNPYKTNEVALPNRIIATYTGENVFLYETFYKQFKKSKKMFYCDKNLWVISFVTLILYAYKNNDIADFLKKEFKISDNTLISITITLNQYVNTLDWNIENFLEHINEQDSFPKFTITLRELQKRLGRITSDDFLYFDEPKDLFDILMRSCTGSHPAISKIDVVIDSEVNLYNLSEGEKKLILIKSILEFIADQDTLLLFDEPDANIHESRKICLYNQIKYYTKYGRQIIMTTHSPVIAKIADEDELIYIESQSGTVSEIKKDKIDLIRKLSSDEWNIMEAGVFLNSEKPLVLFEGKSDITYVRRAIELLKIDNPKYEKINIDILSFNGTGNAEEFLRNIREIVPNKKLIFFFDRDSGGKDGMSHVIGKSKDDELIIHYRDYEDDTQLLKASFLPCLDDNSEQSFMIEDYFSKEKIEEIFNELIKIEHPYTKVIGKKFEEKFKERLESKCVNYSKSEFQGFTLLLNKLLELLEID